MSRLIFNAVLGGTTTLESTDSADTFLITVPAENGTLLLKDASGDATFRNLTLTGAVLAGAWNGSTIAVPYGGTGATTLTGYVKGSGTSAMTASAAIPNTDITGLGTMSTQNASAVSITGGAFNGTVGATTPSTVVATQVDITAQGDLRLQDTTGGQYVALQAPGTVASSYTLTLPVDDGTAGQALITDGSGVLSWSSAASGDVYGPASATDNAVARFDSTTGKIIQNSAVTIADDGATVIAANSSSDALRITQVGTGNALLVEDSANPDASPFVIDASGNVVQGKTTARTNYFGGAATPPLQGVTFISVDRGGAFDAGPAFILSKNRGATSDNTIVVSADTLGQISFQGADGTNLIPGAQIQAQVDGTPGTNDMPGRLVFSTTADGASSPTERMRIDSAGRVGIGGTATTGEMLALRNTAETTATVFGFRNVSNVNQATTTTAYGITDQTQILSPAALTNLFRFRAAAGSFSGTVTNQYGYAADSTLTGATNNYGFYSNIASGTGRWNFYAGGTAANVFAGTTSIGGTVGAESLRVTPVASAVNYYNITGGVTTGSPYIAAQGSDANIHSQYLSKGTYGHIFNTGSAGNFQFYVAHTASAVNYLQVTGAATGGGVLLSTTGSDANVAMLHATKGTGQHFFYTNSAPQFAIANTTSAVNYLQVTGGATGGGATLSAQGSDTNIDLALTPKGTGNVRFGTLTANADAPITGYVTIKDSAGNLRKLAVIN